MELSITTLSDNAASARRGLLAETGLSFLVEVDNLTILLDAGQSISTVHNADALGIDLSRIDKIVLSHGHYDHTGGLQYVLARMRKEIEVIAHPDIWALKYSYNSREERYNYSGIPLRREEVESLGASFRLTPEPVWLAENIVTSGEIPMVTEYEEIPSNLCVKEGDGFLTDPLWDDQALFIKTEQGLVVVLGCGHHGIINTLRHAQKLTGMEIIHTVVGGAHFNGASELQLELSIAELRELGVQRMGLCHCTGMWAEARLAFEFGESFFFNNTGTRITL
ncbi:MBL fold metallo-hydrolase [Chloroflexota bacterium]